MLGNGERPECPFGALGSVRLIDIKKPRFCVVYKWWT